jgi:hypothetical protein
MLPPQAETNGITITSEKIDLCMMLSSMLLDAVALMALSAAFVPRHFRGAKARGQFLPDPRDATQRGRITPAHIESGRRSRVGTEMRARHTPKIETIALLMRVVPCGLGTSAHIRVASDDARSPLDQLPPEAEGTPCICYSSWFLASWWV